MRIAVLRWRRCSVWLALMLRAREGARAARTVEQSNLAPGLRSLIASTGAGRFESDEEPGDLGLLVVGGAGCNRPLLLVQG